jgi:pimeloyl-ACP methyl ester carboxylesterase
MKKSDLLLLHGALGDKSQFDSLIPLIEANFTVHTLDFEGHGHAPLIHNIFRNEHFMENIINYLDKHDLFCVDIFGYSMGGFVGLCMAGNHPQRVRRVFTLATKFNWTPAIAAKEATFLDADTIEKKVPLFARALEERHKAAGWKKVLALTREMFFHIGNNKPLTDSDFQKIANPVRLSLGDRDMMVSIEETVAVFRSLPDGQLQILPSTYHPFEKVPMDIIAGAIISFFNT